MRMLKTYGNSWNPLQSVDICENRLNSNQLGSSKGFFRGSIPFANQSNLHENQWNNSQLGSSRGFFRGSIPVANVGNLGPRNLWKSMETDEISWNLRTSMKIDEIAASWDRVKISLGPAFRFQTSVTSDLEIFENPWHLQLGSSKGFFGSSAPFANVGNPAMEFHEIPGDPWKSMR